MPSSMCRSIVPAVLSAAAFLLPVFTGPFTTPALAQERPGGDRPFLEVSGTGEVSLPADRALITFAVETEATSAREAGASNAVAMEAVRAALSGAGSEAIEIETFGYSVEPRYRRPAQGEASPEIDGYRARNQIRVTVDRVEGVGILIDAALDAGANRVAGLAFQARETDAARLEALRRAVARAREEASAIADALGVPLGAALEVRGGAQLPGPRVREEMFRTMDAVTTPIEAGMQSVSASVTIRYALDP